MPATDESRPEIQIGGQAVIEGVVMRGPEKWALAVRRPSGDMYVSVNPTTTLSQKYPAWNKFLVRGIFALADSLVIGIKSLTVSGAISLEEAGDGKKDAGEQQSDSAGQPPPDPDTEVAAKADDQAGTIEQADPASRIVREITTRDEAAEEASASLSTVAIMMAMVFSLALFMGLFIVVPAVIANWASPHVHNTVVYNLIEGGIRVGIFVGYLGVVSLLPDIRRVFQYHGAEHKVVHTYEAGLTLTPENASGFSTAHMRCGTAFLMIVLIMSILIFSLMGRPALWIRVLERLAVIPLVAAFSYEIIKIAGRHEDSTFVKVIMAPGLLLQRITTKEPDEEQLEVAIESLKAAVGSRS